MGPSLRLLSALTAWLAIQTGTGEASIAHGLPGSQYIPGSEYPSAPGPYPSAPGPYPSAPGPYSPGGNANGVPFVLGIKISKCLVFIEANDGRRICVTRRIVDEAFSSLGRHGARPPPYNATQRVNEDSVDELGRALVGASIALARRLGLTSSQASESLPLIPTEQTAIDLVCPVPFRSPPVQPCHPTRFRAFDGQCNNLEHPYYGASLTRVKRFLPPVYEDGLAEPRCHGPHSSLPSVRRVSHDIHSDVKRHGQSLTLYFVVWGQLIDHDIVDTSNYRDLREKDQGVKCCPAGSGAGAPQQLHPECMPIAIDPRDPFYSQHGQTCMNFVRSRHGVTFGCRLGPREQMNVATSFLDAGYTYGSSQDRANSLRSFEKGQLKVERGVLGPRWKYLMPLKRQDPDAGCVRHDDSKYCFAAGDGRANEQVALCALHTLMMRFHNDIALKLSYVNPHWDDERLFQEARRIVVASAQHITFTEFLPALLGQRAMEIYGLNLEPRGYWNGYDPTIDPSTATEFSSAAFRVGHTFLPSFLYKYSYDHRELGRVNLRDVINRPWEIQNLGMMDQYTLGMANQLADAYDQGVTEEVGNHLFQQPGQKFGRDLAAINMQRGRDHGIRGFVFYRQLCGLGKVESFRDLYSIVHDNQTAYKYSQLYKDVGDIDLWSGLISEKAMEGASVGPTLACLIGNQFKDLRRGDRFWYENPGWPSSFSLAQLEEIRKMNSAALLCDQTDHIFTIQRNPMQLPDYERNPRASCKTAEIPRMDLRKWKEVPRYPAVRPASPGRGSAEQAFGLAQGYA